MSNSLENMRRTIRKMNAINLRTKLIKKMYQEEAPVLQGRLQLDNLISTSVRVRQAAEINDGDGLRHLGTSHSRTILLMKDVPAWWLLHASHQLLHNRRYLD
jgi:hypothetical protein